MGYFQFVLSASCIAQRSNPTSKNFNEVLRKDFRCVRKLAEVRSASDSRRTMTRGSASLYIVNTLAIHMAAGLLLVFATLISDVSLRDHLA